MELLEFEVNGALLALRMKEWVEVTDRTEGGRVPRYRHQADRRLGVGPHEKAVLAELLMRGPQAPGALKPRVARMGYDASPEQIEALLGELAGRGLVEQLPRQPRERDHRWGHKLGPRDAAHEAVEEEAPAASGVLLKKVALSPSPAPGPGPAPGARPETRPTADLERRVAALEAEIQRLRHLVDALQTGDADAGTP
jgi:uncharacterized protein YceH (UPF0502 family)